MAFNSIEYFVFLAVVVAVFWTAPQRFRPQLLLLASYVFYGWWDWRLCGLLAFTTVSTWVGGALVHRADRRSVRITLLVYTLLLSLGVLVAFKVYGYFVASLGATGSELALLTPTVGLLVPVGLSFYTFQAVSYVVDVYRGQQKPEPSLVSYALFVSFFPHLLAGPILRARRLIPELKELPQRLEPVARAEGLELLLTGLFKKVCVGDVLTASAAAIGTTDTADGTFMMLVGLSTALIGAYFDIAGYIDIARGSAKLLGVYLQPNFAQPLTRSRTLTDFWRRWQITVMAWFRDYVYLPVRGRSRSVPRELVAVFAVFAAVGIWHGGSSLGWAVWAVSTTAVLVAERIVRERRVLRTRERRRAAVAAGGGAATPTPASGPPPTPSPLRRAGQVLYVWAVLLFTVCWLAADDLGGGVDLLSRVVLPRGGPFDLDGFVFLVYGVLALLLFDRRELRVLALEGRPDPPGNVRIAAFALMVAGIVVFSGQASVPFLYFRF